MNQVQETFNERSRGNVLISQGHFAEVLLAAESIDPDSVVTNRDSFRRTIASGLRIKAFRYMGKYDEAIAEQQRDSENELYASPKKSINPFSVKRDLFDIITQPITESLQVEQILTMIQLCLEAGKFGAASEHWGRVPVSVRSTDTALLCNATGAWLAATQGNGAKANKLIANALAEKPEKESTVPQIGYAVAHAYLALHDYENASKQLRTLIQNNANEPLLQAEYRTLLGQCYQGQENSEAAQSEYEQVVAAGFEEAAFTSTARTRLAQIQADR